MTARTPGTATDWSIQEIARLAGTTSRTLRHYDDVGLLAPSRVGHNGYRYYDGPALVRLQRILLLRDLGVGLPAIAEILERDGEASPAVQARALRTHLDALRAEELRLARQIASVEHTITTMEGGGRLMADEMFDGFDHTKHEAEVTERWGAEAYRTGDTWWRGLSAQDKAAYQERTRQLGADWTAAAAEGVTPDSDEAQALARRHVEWLSGIPGTPGHGGAPVKEYVVGLGEMYVADERFAANYGGVEGARLVRDALAAYAERNL
ncbi:MerR family transcriptional regulator [Oerskovia jenensis]|uniref:DNA-binding transcriptional MerR regulator n=1 Tax=Oerskovia jenensis TaxID=162169 RepID=A0ABS2LGZ2_9CELL|nr:MerR family transcriptional regulator [Oerskovia jenensis]MBM7479690.1 DNA-binding transcriptional MerR regulator [Oerskovia jenensis]